MLKDIHDENSPLTVVSIEDAFLKEQIGHYVSLVLECEKLQVMTKKPSRNQAKNGN